MSLFLFAIKKTQHTFHGVNHWIISTAFIAFGYLFIALRDIIPVIASILISKFLFFNAGFIRLYGLKIFFNRKVTRAEKIISGITFSAFYAAIVYYTFFEDSMFLRTLIDGILYAGITIFIGLLILQNKTQKNSRIYTFSAFIFFIYAAITIIRITGWIAFPEARHVFAHSFFNDIQFISNMMIDITWTAMFFVIYNLRLTIDLKVSEEKYKSIFINSYSGIILINKEGRYSDINPRYEAITGFSRSEVIDKPIGLLTHPEDLPKVKAALKGMLTQALTSYNNQIRVTHKNGTIVWVQLNAITNFKQNGEFDNILVEIIDINSQKNAEQVLKEREIQLQELNHSKDTFIAILAHDLKNPFNALLGFSDILLQHLNKLSIEQIEAQVKLINLTSYNTYNLLEDLLLWSQSQSGKLKFNPIRVDFNDICTLVVRQMRNLAESKNIEIQYAASEPILLMADSSMVKTILRNLIGNAIKFTHEYGSIQIYVEQNENTATIAVHDNGVGIDKTNQAKLWDFRQQYSTTGTAHETGTGFGLLLCKEFVAKHNGTIWVESELGKGSTFKFNLPLFIV